MPDFQITNPTGAQWDLDLVDGDLVLYDASTPEGNAAAVAQRVVYALMTWLGESVYSPGEGAPHLEVLGSLAGAEGLAGLYALIVQRVPGVDEITDFAYDPPAHPDFVLRVSMSIRAGSIEVPIALAIPGVP